MILQASYLYINLSAYTSIYLPLFTYFYMNQHFTYVPVFPPIHLSTFLFSQYMSIYLYWPSISCTYAYVYTHSYVCMYVCMYTSIYTYMAAAQKHRACTRPGRPCCDKACDRIGDRRQTLPATNLLTTAVLYTEVCDKGV